MADVIKVTFRDHEFMFCPTPQAPAMIKEIFSDNYQVLAKGIEFRDGDVIIDAGANEGMFSILMSKLFPSTRIIALEPVPNTYYNLCNNINMNGCKNIEAFCLGLGRNNQPKTIMTVPNDLSGGSTAWCNTFEPENHTKVEVGLISLDAAFELYGIKSCRLLKMDIEGAEYEVLYGTEMLSHVDYLVMEVHINKKLEFESRRQDGLINWVAKQTKLLSYSLCKMAE
jgi:FkbM family methyltransferase